MDASLDGAGLCSAPLSGNVVKELWRFSEHKGFYTRLVAPATATLTELGLETMAEFGAPAEAFDVSFPLHPSLTEGFRLTAWSSFPAKLTGVKLTVLLDCASIRALI